MYPWISGGPGGSGKCKEKGIIGCICVYLYVSFMEYMISEILDQIHFIQIESTQHIVDALE